MLRQSAGHRGRYPAKCLILATEVVPSHKKRRHGCMVLSRFAVGIRQTCVSAVKKMDLSDLSPFLRTNQFNVRRRRWRPVDRVRLDIAGIATSGEVKPLECHHGTRRRKGEQSDRFSADDVSGDVLGGDTSLVVAKSNVVCHNVRDEADAESLPRAKSARDSSMKHFRPRFSIRTLAIFVTLVCCYFGAWGATKRYVEKSWRYDVGQLSSPMPFVICETSTSLGHITSSGKFDPRGKSIRHWQLWLLGPKIKLPFESEWDAETLVSKSDGLRLTHYPINQRCLSGKSDPWKHRQISEWLI
jgi:hypothetical protein